jgi:hypothetical protein
MTILEVFIVPFLSLAGRIHPALSLATNPAAIGDEPFNVRSTEGARSRPIREFVCRSPVIIEGGFDALYVAADSRRARPRLSPTASCLDRC